MFKPSWANSASESALATSEPARPTSCGVDSRAAITQNNAPAAAIMTVVANVSAELTMSWSLRTARIRVARALTGCSPRCSSVDPGVGRAVHEVEAAVERLQRVVVGQHVPGVEDVRDT